MSIEDGFLVIQGGCKLLSGLAPRRSEETEALMKESSPFGELVLPELKDQDCSVLAYLRIHVIIGLHDG